MWFLPTYNRPVLAQQALDACEQSGMTSPGVLFVDHPTDLYRGIRLPANWVVHFADHHYDMAPSMNWLLALYPNEPFYGWLSDDLRPRTPGWDKRLEKAAGRFHLAHCNDLWLALDGPSIRDGSLCGAFCWGGDLIRAVGWWALPGTRQAGTDDAWVAMLDPVYLPDVVVEHLQYKNCKRNKDSTDSWIRDGVHYVQQDLDYYKAWGTSVEFSLAVERLQVLGDQVRIRYHATA